MKMEQIGCSETSAYKIQTPGELPRRKHTTKEGSSVETEIAVGN